MPYIKQDRREAIAKDGFNPTIIAQGAVTSTALGHEFVELSVGYGKWRAGDIESPLYDVQEVGELNYCLTMLAISFVKMKGQSYEKHQDVIAAFERAKFTIITAHAYFAPIVMDKMIGAIECAKLEYTRRAVAPYEDTKIAANGDVY